MSPEAEEKPSVFRVGGVTYLRIPAEDRRRSAAFYEAVFGWQVHRRESGQTSFDDGTGSDPGPRVDPGSSHEPRTYVDPTTGQTLPRKCWTPADGIPAAGDQQYYQGDIGTHGLHLLFQVESDNARQQVPIDEIVSEQRMVMLPGQQPNVGEQYGREFEKPLVVRVRGGGAAAGSVSP